MGAIDILKLQLDDFFERSKEHTVNTLINNEKIYFNKSLFELEKHLYDLKQKYKVNQNLNISIVSKNILESFSDSPTFFRSDDYSLSFLVFLAMHENHDAENLLEYMDEYIEIVKDKFSFKDIFITGTGATRCHTNLRFSLNSLRKLGLIYSITDINHIITRSVMPTPLGYLIALYVSDLKNDDVINLLGNNSKELQLFAVLSLIKHDPTKFFNKIISTTFKPELIKNITSTKESVIKIASMIELNNDDQKFNEDKIEKTMKIHYLNNKNQVKMSFKLKESIFEKTLFN
jgi:hypothetical protein